MDVRMSGTEQQGSPWIKTRWMTGAQRSYLGLGLDLIRAVSHMHHDLILDRTLDLPEDGYG